MNTWIGGALALAALLGGGFLYGWQGVMLSLTVVVFWLLLQFSRLMRVMRAASEGPVGHVDSAVMFNAKLRAGMKLVDVLPLTRSLGQKISDQPEVYGWTDAGGARVELQMDGGTVRSWTLHRPEDAPKAQQAS